MKGDVTVTADIVDLLPAQEQEWSRLMCLAPDTPGIIRHNNVVSFHVTGVLDVARLRKAGLNLANAQEALRSYCDSSTDRPQLRVNRRPEMLLEIHDLSGVPEHRQQKELSSISYSANFHVFDYFSGPLWKVIVVTLEPLRHVVFSSMADFLADGDSTQALGRMLLSAYDAGMDDGNRLRRRRTYRELLDIERQSTSRTNGVIKNLAQALSAGKPVEIPFKHRLPGPDEDIFDDTFVNFSVRTDTANELRKLAWASRTTVFVVFLTAYAVLLRTIMAASGDVIVLGTTASSRHNTDVIAKMDRNVYLPILLRPSTSIQEAIANAHHALVESIDNYVSWFDVAKHLGFSTSSRSELDIIHGYIEAVAPRVGESIHREQTIRLGNVVPCRPESGKPLLTVAEVQPRFAAWTKRCSPWIAINETRDGGFVKYNRTLFGDDLAQEIAESFVGILERFAANPAILVKEAAADVR